MNRDSSKIKYALEIATKVHKGQVDKAGEDYINHPLRVANSLQNEDEIIVALLHDTIEDTNVTAEYLLNSGFSRKIVDAVLALTRRKDESYDDFIIRCKENEIAKKVKIRDILDNLNLSRLKEITDEDIKRNNKYLNALKNLIL